MTIRIPAVPSLVAHVRKLPGDYFLCREVADALEVSTATLRRLAQQNPVELGPTRVIQRGPAWVGLYDETAVNRLRAHLAAHGSRRGRPRLWTDDERTGRRAAFSAAGYRRRRAAELRARGDHDGADEAERVAAQLYRSIRVPMRPPTTASRAIKGRDPLV